MVVVFFPFLSLNTHPPPNAYFIGLCGRGRKVMFLAFPPTPPRLLVGKDSFGEASRFRDRRLYLGVGAAGSKSPQQDPSLLAFVVASVGFLFTPLPRFPMHFVASTQESRVHF